MGNDLRMSNGFQNHPKTMRLKGRLGAEGVLCLLQLWDFASQYKHSGALTGMRINDIEVAASWTGQDGQFVETLVDIKFLDRTRNNYYRLHNWKQRQPFVANFPERSKQARKAAKAKRDKRRKELRSTESPPQDNGSHNPSSVSVSDSDSDSVTNSLKKRSRKHNDKGNQNHSDHHKFKIFWVQLFKDRRHNDYVFQGAKDGKVIKDMLAAPNASLEELKDLAAIFFDWDDKFLRDGGYTLGLMLMKLNALRGRLRESGGSRKTERPTGEF